MMNRKLTAVANEKQLALLKQGGDVWNEWRRANPEVVLVFEGADLALAVLKKAELTRANLRGVNLQGGDLQGADLRRANLEGANLRGANLQAANLQAANLRGADLQAANLQGANLQAADLQRANLQAADLQRANLQLADLRGANLKELDLTKTKLWGSILRGADLEEASLPTWKAFSLSWKGKLGKLLTSRLFIGFLGQSLFLFSVGVTLIATYIPYRRINYGIHPLLFNPTIWVILIVSLVAALIGSRLRNLALGAFITLVVVVVVLILLLFLNTPMSVVHAAASVITPIPPQKNPVVLATPVASLTPLPSADQAIPVVITPFLLGTPLPFEQSALTPEGPSLSIPDFSLPRDQIIATAVAQQSGQPLGPCLPFSGCLPAPMPNTIPARLLSPYRVDLTSDGSKIISVGSSGTVVVTASIVSNESSAPLIPLIAASGYTAAARIQPGNLEVDKPVEGSLDESPLSLQQPVTWRWSVKAQAMGLGEQELNFDVTVYDKKHTIVGKSYPPTLKVKVTNVLGLSAWFVVIIGAIGMLLMIIATLGFPLVLTKRHPKATPNNIESLIVNYTRRLQYLEKREALKGVNTEPEILIEIEDIERKLKELKQQRAESAEGETAASK